MSYSARYLCPWKFSRQDNWTGLPCLPPGDLPNLGIESSLLHYRWILHHQSHQRSPGVLYILLLLLLSRFSRVRLCVTPEMAAHQAPPPLGFSRQEHWIGLPFPSPMHESGKWKVKVPDFHPRLWVSPWTATYQALPSMGFSRQEYWSGLHCLLCHLQRGKMKLFAKRSLPLKIYIWERDYPWYS